MKDEYLTPTIKAVVLQEFMQIPQGSDSDEFGGKQISLENYDANDDADTSPRSVWDD